ncbi:MAG: diguanylate cyclase [Deltaproteobacteria bacterium]|nr:diguanylate cyclase [Candidatus Anaeroferrophillus wilburensis]MBN2889671.1 diguanylate cyclase [Deltaproteobacteria bacterium]
MDIALIKEYKTLSQVLLKALGSSYRAEQPIGKTMKSLLTALETAGEAAQIKDIHRQIKELLVKETPQNVESLGAEVTTLKQDIMSQSLKDKELSSLVSGMKSLIALSLREVEGLSDQDEKLRHLFEEVRQELAALNTLEDLNEFSRHLKNLFYQKALVQGVVEQERDELKNIIVIMAATLTSFLDIGGAFSSNLDSYAKRLQVVKELSEIQSVRDLLLKETLSLKEQTGRMITEVQQANARVESANQKIEKLKQQMEKIKEEVIIDPLTKVYNRRAFDDKIKQEFASFKRYDSKTSLIMLDIDHFKIVNDTYGHRTGDGVLRVVAGILKKEIRDIDVLARYGGEEFIIVLPHTTLQPAVEVAERLRMRVSESRFAYKGERFSITASFGVAELQEDDTLDAYLRRVDAALYEAKDAGRNQVKASVMS